MIVNCIFNDDDAYCNNKNIKKSLWGIGARICKEFGDEECNWKIEYPRPQIAPRGQGLCFAHKRKHLVGQTDEMNLLILENDELKRQIRDLKIKK